MPNCESCGHQWGWADSMKVSMMYYSGKKCPHCGERQFISPSTRRKQWIVYLVLLFLILFIRPLFDISVALNMMITMPVILIMIFSIPFTIQLANEQKPLW